MKDGHIHSPYCPHGSSDSFEKYIENAIEVGLEEITFTEHLPLPKNFTDPSPKNDSAMDISKISEYIKEVNILKEKYRDKIKINLGVEVDYIEGYEKGIKEILDKYGKNFDDAIISVHMINIDDKIHLIDYSCDEFNKLINILGGIDKVYEKYYDTVIKAINADLGAYKPKRIGHLNLPRKFNKSFPYDYSKNKTLMELIQLIKEKGYELDYNIAGYVKKDCGEAYISGKLLELVKEYNIPMIMGSDSHNAEHIKYFKELKSIPI